VRDERPRVLVVADDIIWSTRLAGHLRTAGAEPLVIRSAAARDHGPDVVGAVVDLTARAYDGVAVVKANRAAGRAVLAVGQHDDHDLRRRALAAGADRVLAYRKLLEDGPATLRGWLETVVPKVEETTSR
jgi:DNA-binding response OmpR family regulator